MTIRPVRLFGDPVLVTPADPVTDFDRQVRRLVKDLTQTLRDQDGPACRPRRSASGCGYSCSTSTACAGT